MRKTAADIKRERIALAVSGGLIGTGISVCGGGRKGPYTVIVTRVRRRDLARLVGEIRESLGREAEEEPS